MASDIETGTPVWLLYQRLRRDGVGNSALDSGYRHVDYLKKQTSTVQRGDGEIQTEEILKYALERYRQHASTIRETLGYAIPWSLDDLDPNTSFDENLRKKIDAAIETFGKLVSRAGYATTTERRDELMAMALFAFTLWPQNGRSPEQVPPDLKATLRSARLEGVLRYLGTEGGLGRIDVQRDCVFEAPALEALKSGCGRCSEDSRILYGVFERAGLKARMVYAKLKYAAMKELKTSPGFLHFSLGLPSGKTTRFFDMANRDWDAEPLYRKHMHWWFAASNRQALSLHYAGSCIRHVKASKPDLAIEECEKALHLDPLSFVAFVNLGAAQEKKDRLDLAAANFKRALNIHPGFAEAHYGLGRVYYRMGELGQAAERFDKAIQLHPDFAQAHNNLGVVHLDQKDHQRAIFYFQKALSIKPEDPSYLHNLRLAKGNCRPDCQESDGHTRNCCPVGLR